jgi:hypothetical protein
MSKEKLRDIYQQGKGQLEFGLMIQDVHLGSEAVRDICLAFQDNFPTLKALAEKATAYVQALDEKGSFVSDDLTPEEHAFFFTGINDLLTDFYQADNDLALGDF